MHFTRGKYIFSLTKIGPKGNLRFEDSLGDIPNEKDIHHIEGDSWRGGFGTRPSEQIHPRERATTRIAPTLGVLK